MRARTRLFLDLALATSLLVAFYPKWTGVPVHQWLSMAIIAPMILHLVVNWEWVLRVAKAFFEKLLSASRLNFTVDTALLVATVTVILSGFMVSPGLLAPLGIRLAPSIAWHVVHSWSANATITLFAVHAALHWRWMFGVAKRLVADLAAGPGRTRQAAPRAAATAMAAAAPSGRRAPDRRSRGRERSRQAAAERRAAMRTASVIAATASVALAVFSSVMLADPLLASGRTHAKAPVRKVVAARGEQACPATGCVATGCHASAGKSASAFYGKAKVAAGLKTARTTGAAKKTRSAGKTTVAMSAGHRIGGLIRSARPKRRIRNMAPPPPPVAVAAAHTAPGAPAGKVGGAAKAKVVASSAKKKSAPVRTASAKKRRKKHCPVTGCGRYTCHGSNGASPGSWYASHN